jgi:hypothetical protein
LYRIFNLFEAAATRSADGVPPILAWRDCIRRAGGATRDSGFTLARATASRRPPARKCHSLKKEVNLATLGAITLPERRWSTLIVATILALVAVRLVFAAVIPLSFEEATYWVYSRHIGAGYFDQPPIEPILIRLSTTLFGDNEFGVRALGVLLALPASWAVWRSGTIQFGEAVGARAALYFNLTLVMAAGSIIATPDGPLVAATALLLLALAKLLSTGRARWWLLIGVVFGLGILSKYTMFLFAVSILAWLLLVPEMRKWLLTPWPWLSGLIAVAMFSPTVWWNAEHGWSSARFQFGRMVVHEWDPRYFFEYILGQIGMATPAIFVLGLMGLVASVRGEGGSRSARVLVNAMVWPIVIFFAWHSFHDRVQGNWPEPIFVAFVIAAAIAVETIEWDGGWKQVEQWSRRLAVPTGLAIAAFIYLQAAFGIVPLGQIDPTARAVGAGWKELGAELDQVRMKIGAPIVLGTDHAVTGWLAFYLPSRPPVEQIGERIRYANAPEPDPALFQGPIMFVCTGECDVQMLHDRFATVDRVTSLQRTRRGVPIQDYSIYRVSGPIVPPLDPL